MTGDWKAQLRDVKDIIVAESMAHYDLRRAKDRLWDKGIFSAIKIEDAEIELYEKGFIKYCSVESHAATVCVHLVKKDA